MISVTATGFVRTDTEIHYVGDTPVIKFRVVDKQRVKNKVTGEYESHFESVTFECWGDDALYYAERLTKGRNVEAFGNRPRTEKWAGEGGQERSEMVFKLLHVGFPFQEPASQPVERQGNAPQGQPRQMPSQQRQQQQPRQAPRYAQRQQGQQANDSRQNDAEPKPYRPEQSNQQREGGMQPSYQDPRVQSQNQGGQVTTQNRFKRGSAAGSPRTQY